MSLYAVECFANDTLTITSDLILDNSVTWNVASQVITLDFQEIFDTSNINVGILNASLTPIVPNNVIIPNSNNFTLILAANSYQTSELILGSINPYERTLIIQTVFNSNTGTIFHANNMYLRVKNAQI